MRDKSFLLQLKQQRELFRSYIDVLHRQEAALKDNDFSSAQVYLERSQYYILMLQDYEKVLRGVAFLIACRPTLRSLKKQVDEHREEAQRITQRVLKQLFSLKKENLPITFFHTRNVFSEKPLARMIDLRY